jgi:hypothetical protein
MDQEFFNGKGKNKKGSTQREMDMKKTICIVFAILALLFSSVLPGYARDRGHYHGSGHYHGPRYYFGGGVWIGPGWGGWGPWWLGPPYYPEPPVVIQQQPPVYVEPTPQPEEQSYWYYCPNPPGYYPYVKKCPNGWMKVIPSPVPPDEGD